MPGLSLRGGAGIGASANAGGLMPVAAGTPTGPRGGTSSNAAFGISAGGYPGTATGAIGTGVAAAAATLILLFLWYSLPR